MSVPGISRSKRVCRYGIWACQYRGSHRHAAYQGVVEVLVEHIEPVAHPQVGPDLARYVSSRHRIARAWTDNTVR
eukprot:3941326-Rhodomonas_salina.1